MKTYSIIKISASWSTETLKRGVEKILHEKSNEGYEIVSVAFSLNMWWKLIAFVTICK